LFRFGPHLICVISFFCVVGGLALPANGQSTIPVPSLHQAEVLVDEGHFDEALPRLAALAALQPEPAGVEFLRGLVFYQQGRMSEASKAFSNAVMQNPKDLAAMQMEGVSLFRAGKPADAVPLLEQAHSAVPAANVDPNYVLGLCYMDTRRYDDARKAFAGQYGFTPDSAPAYLLAGRMFLRRSYLPIAEESVRKAIGLNPTLPQAHLLLGDIALAHGKATDAIADFEQESSLNPLDGAAYERLGDAYIHAGDFERAKRALNRAVLLEPNVNIPFILLGKVLLNEQNSLMARMYLEHALEIDPRNYMAHYLLGQAYRALGRADDATREYQAAARIQEASEPVLESSQ
jgi:tetratricopeptide (TPR) repeat protein